MLNIGDRVVCVDSSMRAESVAELKLSMPNWVKEGGEYTIRQFHDNNGIVLGVLLEEIRNPIVYIKLIDKWQEGAFAEWRFKKLQKETIKSTVEEEQEIFISL